MDAAVASRLQRINSAVEIAVSTMVDLGATADFAIGDPVDESRIRHLESMSGLQIPESVRSFLSRFGTWFVAYQFADEFASCPRNSCLLTRYLFGSADAVEADCLPDDVSLGIDIDYLSQFEGGSPTLPSGMEQLSMGPALPVFPAGPDSELELDSLRGSGYLAARASLVTTGDEWLIVDGAQRGEPIVWVYALNPDGEHRPRRVASGLLTMLEVFAATGLFPFWRSSEFNWASGQLPRPWTELPTGVRRSARKWLDLLGIRDRISQLFPGGP